MTSTQAVTSAESRCCKHETTYSYSPQMTVNKKEILVLGLGNDILMDDGIGPKLAWHLQKTFPHPGVTYDTAAIGGMELIEMIRDYKQVMIIDAIKTFNGIPGAVYHLTPSNFKETLHISHIHDISFLTALQLAKQLSIPVTDKIYIIAVEIIEDLTFGDDFTLPLQAKYEEIKKEVETTLNELIHSQE
jgi:hydrogenase maturation protease